MLVLLALLRREDVGGVSNVRLPSKLVLTHLRRDGKIACALTLIIDDSTRINFLAPPIIAPMCHSLSPTFFPRLNCRMQWQGYILITIFACTSPKLVHVCCGVNATCATWERWRSLVRFRACVHPYRKAGFWTRRTCVFQVTMPKLSRTC